MPPALREDVRLLGSALGRVMAEDDGVALLEDVERLRRMVIAARDDEAAEARVDRLVAAWPIERAERVAHAFTCYFHLANLAEEHHRARALRAQDRGAVPHESLAATVGALEAEQGLDWVRSQLAELALTFVFTAHPTEARRRAVTTAIRRVAEQLEHLDDPRASDTERRDATRRLMEQIDSLWRIEQIRSTKVGPLDEVHSTLPVFVETLFDAAPQLYRNLEAALGRPADVPDAPVVPPFLQFGSWVGGDRDGNPFVTASVTAETMRMQVATALEALEDRTQAVSRELSAGGTSTPPTPALLRRLEEAEARAGPRLVDFPIGDEPHRRFLLYVLARLAATRRDEAAMAYGRSRDFIDDLRCVQTSLVAGGAPRLAYGALQDLIWSAQTFGFHLAELEVRQHSAVHERALRELETGDELSGSTQEVLAT
ncbi:MAG: phosphoenolpyruvate carboxylase, partial [Candidatus Dormibacteraeota bacterium]|nr:phosphoenolpyruvate carboxylase [Candidatus Dormibacteraeota bacterium]